MLKNLSTKTRWAIGAACALVFLVVCAVIVYAANYSGRALPGTTVAGTSVEGMTRDQVRQILGKPGEISRFKRQNEEVWGWRYLEATQRTMFFYAHFDQDTGLLKRTDQMQDWKTSKH